MAEQSNLPQDAKCYDLIEMDDVAVNEFLEADPDNLVFIKPDGKSYSCFNRANLRSNIIDDSYTVYPCRNAFKPNAHGELPLGVGSMDVCKVKMFNLQATYIMPVGLVFLDNLNEVVMNGKQNIIKIKSFDPPQYVPSLVGYNFMRGRTSAVSANHCQPGKQTEVFYLTSEDFPTFDSSINFDKLSASGCLRNKFDLNVEVPFKAEEPEPEPMPLTLDVSGADEDGELVSPPIPDTPESVSTCWDAWDPEECMALSTSDINSEYGDSDDEPRAPEPLAEDTQPEVRPESTEIRSLGTDDSESSGFNIADISRYGYQFGGAYSDVDVTNKTCLDIIMGEEPEINEYIAMDPDNIVFKGEGGDSYMCASREQIKILADDTSNQVLACTGATTFLNITPSMVCGLKLAKVKSLAIGFGGYVSVKNIYDVVINSEDSIFEVEPYPENITINAVSSLKLMREYRPDYVRVPFYREYQRMETDGDDNDDGVTEDQQLEPLGDYVDRLNEWGAENNEPGLGDRWEESERLLVSANHCQSGYEGERILRIVSKANPNYTENPRIWKAMLEKKCVNMETAPVVTDETPEVVREEQFFYTNEDTADGAPVRNLGNMFANMSDSSGMSGNRTMPTIPVNDGGLPQWNRYMDLESQLSSYVQYTLGMKVLPAVNEQMAQGGAEIPMSMYHVNGTQPYLTENAFTAMRTGDKSFFLYSAVSYTGNPPSLIVPMITNLNPALRRPVEGVDGLTMYDYEQPSVMVKELVNTSLTALNDPIAQMTDQVGTDEVVFGDGMIVLAQWANESNELHYICITDEDLNYGLGLEAERWTRIWNTLKGRIMNMVRGESIESVAEDTPELHYIKVGYEESVWGENDNMPIYELSYMMYMEASNSPIVTIGSLGVLGLDGPFPTESQMIQGLRNDAGDSDSDESDTEDNESMGSSDHSDADNDSDYYDSGDEGPDAEDVIDLLLQQVSNDRESLLNSIALVISDGFDTGDTESYVIGNDNLSSVIPEIKEPKSDTTTVMALITRSGSSGHNPQSIYYIINPDSATRQEVGNVIGYGIEVNNYPEYLDKSQEIFRTIDFFARDASAEFANLASNASDTIIPSEIEDPLVVIALFQNGENIIELACMEVRVLLERIDSMSVSEWTDYYEGLLERAISRGNDENTTGNDDKISYVTIEYNERSGDPTKLSIDYSGQDAPGLSEGVSNEIIGGVIGVTTFRIEDVSEIENASDDELPEPSFDNGMTDSEDEGESEGEGAAGNGDGDDDDELPVPTFTGDNSFDGRVDVGTPVAERSEGAMGSPMMSPIAPSSAPSTPPAPNRGGSKKGKSKKGKGKGKAKATRQNIKGVGRKNGKKTRKSRSG